MGVKTIQTIKNSFRQEQISSGNEIYLFCLCYNSRRRFPDNLPQMYENSLRGVGNSP